MCSGKISADRRQEKYILIELLLERFSFLLGGTVSDKFNEKKCG
jgi:hypothetical protein